MDARGFWDGQFWASVRVFSLGLLTDLFNLYEEFIHEERAVRPVQGAHRFPWFGAHITHNGGAVWLANLLYFGISRNIIVPRAIFWYHQNRALTAV